MTSSSESDRFHLRLQDLQSEVAQVCNHLKRAREALEGLEESLPAATEALTSIESATQRAAHDLLGLVEGVQEVDDRASACLEALEESGAQNVDAMSGLRSAHDERAQLYTEMMTALSFQDLTCQTLKRVVGGLEEVERVIGHVLDPAQATGEDGEPVPVLGSMSGLRRLLESQKGSSAQDLVDDLLNR